MPLFRPRQPQPTHLATLRSILVRLSELCTDSEDFINSHSSSEQIVNILREQIDRIDNGKAVTMNTLSLLIAPTGDLQETSIANDWAEEFLQLSAEFDDIQSGITE